MLREQLFAIEAEDAIDGPLHPYLQIYLQCRRYGQRVVSPDGQVEIVPLLPGPGGYLQQDAELMLAFDVLETLMEEIKQANRMRAKNRQYAAAYHEGQMPDELLPM